jgi:hypothetical protein
MWGTSSPGDKLTGDFGDEPDATSISGRGSVYLPRVPVGDGLRSIDIYRNARA